MPFSVALHPVENPVECGFNHLINDGLVDFRIKFHPFSFEREQIEMTF
jgi:hypothetical protein